jgi:hypothetical protein
MDARLRYTREEILQDHPYVKPHEQVGYLLHGGFLADGTYASPRTLNRWPAVKAWGKALKGRGWDLIDASGDLLEHGAYPNNAQEAVLLKAGFGKPFWNSLTTTGVIEARGQALCNVPPIDWQQFVVEDISDMGLGHLSKGLFYAHGADEGGDPADMSKGAHDKMWFAVRDLVFGKDAYPLPEMGASITRPVEGRELPQLPEPIEQIVKLMMNVLMIEIRAEAFFQFCIDVLRDPELWEGKRKEADLGALMVDRIRTDEAIHVAYLQLVLSELRSVTVKTVQGGTISGTDLLDPLWAKMVDWHGRDERVLAAERTRKALETDLITDRGEDAARRILAEFDALTDRGALAVAAE